MRIRVVLDEDLMESALQVSGLRTKKETIEKGLKLLVDVHGHRRTTAFTSTLEQMKLR